jgi:hypothetical protein
VRRPVAAGLLALAAAAWPGEPRGSDPSAAGVPAPSAESAPAAESAPRAEPASGAEPGPEPAPGAGPASPRPDAPPSGPARPEGEAPRAPESGPGRRPPPSGVSPQLPPEHWAVGAAARLEGLGLLTGYFPAQQAVPLLAVWAALEEGARRAEAERPDVAPLARAWRQRLLDEWRGVESEGLLRFLGGQASAGYGWAGVSPAPSATPPQPWSLWPVEANDPFVAGTAAGALSEYLAASVSPVAVPWQVRWYGEAVAGVGPVSLSFGRNAAQYGFGAPGAGVVFGGLAPVERVELFTHRPIDIAIGLLTFDLYLGFLGPPRHAGDPLLWGLSLQYRPVPRLAFGLQRGTMLGGTAWKDATGSGFDVGDFLKTAFGPGNGPENNVISLSARWRLPTESFLPATLHLEWGGDDNGGAWIQAPGIDLGLLLPSLPFAPEVSVGLEASFFGTLCPAETGGTWCRSPGYPLNWYTHGAYVGGWAVGDAPLGHRMGGNGRELWLHAAADLLDARLRVRGDAFVRNRFRGSLYAPYAGTSGGFEAQVVYRVWLGEAGLSGGLEAGPGWTSGRAGVRATVYF